MKLTQDQKDAFRRACGRLECDAEDEVIAFYLANPRIMKALASGQLIETFRRETFPIEPPPDFQVNMMEEAVSRRLIAEGKVHATLMELAVTVDYRPCEDDALAKAGVAKAALASHLYPPGTTLPEFEDWSVAYHVKKRQGGTISRRLRVLSVMAETTIRQVNNLIDLYRFARVDPRTLLEFITAHPTVQDDFPALVATSALVRERKKPDSLAPCLYYVEPTRNASGQKLRRFAVEEIGEMEPHRFSKYGLLVEEPATP